MVEIYCPLREDFCAQQEPCTDAAKCKPIIRNTLHLIIKSRTRHDEQGTALAPIVDQISRDFDISPEDAKQLLPEFIGAALRLLIEIIYTDNNLRIDPEGHQMLDSTHHIFGDI